MLLVQFSRPDTRAVCGLLDPDGWVHAHADGLGMYEFATACIAAGRPVASCADKFTGRPLRYDDLAASGRILPAIDHPDPYRCLISGTGLTHRGSAEARDNMHALKTGRSAQTDSVRLFGLGETGGRVQGEAPGILPEWFYKGDGHSIVAPGADIPSPGFAQGDGEEAEIAGIYVIDAVGIPRRLGFVIGNEYSDHEVEKQNYLYLAHSKLLNCAIGPALLVGDLPEEVLGEVRVLRAGKTFWRKAFRLGRAAMTHDLENLEHHHFKYSRHRRAGDLHVHFLGTSVLSFSDGVKIEAGDEIEITAPVFGPPLRNRIKRETTASLTRVQLA